jgi:transposase
MTLSSSQLPQDLDACHALIRQQQEQLQQQAAIQQQQAQTIEEQQETIDRLTAEMALLRRSLFGPRRERYIDDPQQQYLFESVELETDTGSPAIEEVDQETAAPRRRTSKGRGRRIFPEFLPRKPVHHELKDEEIPEGLRDDPEARRFFKKTSEQLEFEPGSLYVIEHYQEVIVKEDEAGEVTMATAQKPPQLIEAFTGPGFWAYLTASRFADHLPYYRQEDILSRYGFRIHRSTQWRWMFGLAEGVERLVELMRGLTLESLVVGVDETPVKMLDAGSPHAVTSYLWTTIGDNAHPYNCFYFTADRSRDGPDEFLSGFEGCLQSDAYIGYELISAENEEIVKVACWAHARRKFEEVNYTAPSVKTHTALAYIQRLYDIEDRGRELTDQQRYELRQQEAAPIVAEFHQWLVRQHERELPKSKLRGAIGYMLNRWEAFERYLECGQIPIDNNRTEAALKNPVIGRKNWLFFGNPQGGRTAAILLTLTMSCKRHNIDPFAYLRDVYTRLPTMADSELESLLPDRWIQEHPEHRIQERVGEAQHRARRKRSKRAARRRKLQASRQRK